MMTLYTPPFSVKGKLAGELLAPLDILVSLLKLIKIDVGFTLSPELKEEYGTGSKAILIDMVVSLFRPASLFFIFLVLAVVFAWQPLIRPAIANNQPNPAPAAPISVPVIVPPSVTPTMTPSPTLTPTATPTSTITPSPTTTLTPTPTAPLPYAHNLEMELRPVCGLLSWSEVRPVFPEEMKVFGVRHVKDDWVSLDDISCVIFFAVPTDEDGNATGGVGFVFYTLKDEPGIKSITADFTSAYVKENQGFGIIWSVQEADQLFK